MKFVVSSSVLLKHLQNTSRVITQKPLMPMLEYAKLTVKDQDLSIFSTDLDMSILSSFPLEAIEEEGSVCVPARMLLEAVKAFSDIPLHFNVDMETYRVLVTYSDGMQSGEFSLNGKDPIEFSEQVELEASQVVSMHLSSSTLVDVFSKTVFCAAASLAEGRDKNGLLLRATNAGLIVVATDSYQIAKVVRGDIQSESEQSIFVPLRAANTIISILGSGADEELELAFDETFIQISTPSVQFSCRLSENQFPAYENVFAHERPEKLIVNTGLFHSALRQLSPFAMPSTNIVSLDLHPERIELRTGSDIHEAKARQSLACEFNGRPRKIFLPLKRLISMLSQVKSQDLEISLGETAHTGFRPLQEEGEGIETIYLIMQQSVNVPE